jgi:simple sugar transport system ATP-binding protein
VAGLSVRENIVLARQARLPWWRRIADVEQRRMTDDAIDELGIVCPRADTAVEFLSGGNQQKVILARWLSNRPKVLVLDEPTRGIDIGAHAEIIRLIRRLRDQGLTVIVASSELDELIAFSDTIVVLRSGKTVAEFRGPGISEQAIVTALAGSE